MASCQSNVQNIDDTNSFDDQSAPPISENTIWKIYPNYVKEVSIEGFYKSYYLVQNEKGYGIVNSQNEVLMPFTSNHILYHKNSFAKKVGDHYQFYQSKKDPIGQLELDSIYHNYIGDHYVGVKDDLKSVIDMDGKILSKELYDQIDFPNDQSYFFGLKEEIWKAYDFQGNQLPIKHPSKFSLNILNNYSVALKSLGPIRLGMSVPTIEKALGTTLHNQIRGEDCRTYNFGQDQINIILLTENNKSEIPIIERMYIASVGIKTKSGIGVGDLEKTLNVTYPGYLEHRGHPYNELGKDYYFVPKDAEDKNYRINFYVDEYKRIDSYSIGREPAIYYKEGCF